MLKFCRFVKNLILFLAKGIRRPLFAIYRRVLRMYDRRNYVGKYSSEEVQQLKSLKEKHGNDWATIGAAMGRSASSVKDRFRLMREHCHSGNFSPSAICNFIASFNVASSECSAPYSGLCGEGPPKRCAFFRFAVHSSVRKIVILVYERVTNLAAK